MINKLYGIERELKDSDDEQRLIGRQQKERTDPGSVEKLVGENAAPSHATKCAG